MNTHDQVQGLSTTGQIEDSNKSIAHPRTVTTLSSPQPNAKVTSSATHTTLQIEQRQLQPLQPRLSDSLTPPQRQITPIQQPQVSHCLLDQPSEYQSLPSFYPRAFLPQQGQQNGPVFQNYSTQPLLYPQPPQYHLQHHPQFTIQQSHHSFNPPAPTLNSFAPSQPYPVQLPQQSQYLTQFPHTFTPQNADFVQPFLPGRTHHYAAYTSEDTTSSQFR